MHIEPNADFEINEEVHALRVQHESSTMTRTDPVFRSVGQALHVAHLMEILPATHKGSTQTLIEQLMREACVEREVERDGSLNFRGLGPLDVRAQCAMVRGAVLHHCTEPERYAITAWYSHDSKKAEGVRYLHQWVRDLWTIENKEAQMLLMWRANVTDDSKAAKHCSVRDIEGQYGIPKSTVHRQLAAITKSIRGLRRNGEKRLEELFEQSGLVGTSEETVA